MHLADVADELADSHVENSPVAGEPRGDGSDFARALPCSRCRSASLERATNVLEQPGRFIKRFLVPPEPARAPAPGSRPPRGKWPCRRTVPSRVEHESRVENHEPDREKECQNQHGQGDEIAQPWRIVSTACHPWNPSWNLARPGSTSLVLGIRRKNPPDGITTKTPINPLIGKIGPEP